MPRKEAYPSRTSLWINQTVPEPGKIVTEVLLPSPPAAKDCLAFLSHGSAAVPSPNFTQLPFCLGANVLLDRRVVRYFFLGELKNF